MKRSILLFLFAIGCISLEAKDFKGAEIYSTQSYLYGRIEMSIKAASGSGQISSFFLYRNGSEQSSVLWQEIDIEIFGKDTNSFQSNVIVEAVEGKQQTTEQIHLTPRSLSANYHVYAIEWTPDSIRWFIDDSLIRTEKSKAKLCNAAMSLRFNHWASNSTTWVGAFNTSILPQYQYVDWISYSSYTPGTGDNGSDFTFQWKDDFSTFDNTRWAKANWTFTGNVVDFLPENAYTENNHLVLKLHNSKPSAIEEKSIKQIIEVFPNPSSNTFSIKIHATSSAVIHLTQTDGKIIYSSTLSNTAYETEINAILEKKNDGIYILSVYDKNNIIDTKTIIKQSN